MFKIFQHLEYLLSKIQGISYGISSIDTEIKSIRKFVPDGEVFVDVGGNKGLYTEGLIRYFKPKEIHIFEPSDINFKLLKNKFLNHSEIHINKFALSDKISNSTLYSDKYGSGLGSLTKRRLGHLGIDFSESEEIQLIRFEDYWRENLPVERIDLMKIDVEGHELDVLHGIGDNIKNIKVIQFEFGGCNIDTRTFFQDFWYFFKDKKFVIYRITPIGVFRIDEYSENLERFQTTNYFCVNKRI
jgi:FkbM family methyltransferase